MTRPWSAGVLLVCLALGACRRHAPASAPPGEVATVRVMTFNIAAGNGDLARIAATIRDANADIAGLQEVDVHWSERSAFVGQADSLARLLGMEVRFAPIYDIANVDRTKPPRQFGVALLSRHPVVGVTNHAITRHSTVTPNAPPSPMPGLLDATVSVHGTRVHAFVTHLDYRADPAVRRVQVAETVRILDRTDGPVLLLGDLNATPEAPELAPLLARVPDTWRAGDGPGFSYPAALPTKRIDYVLARGFAVHRARVIETRASDHRPVVAELVLERR